MPITLHSNESKFHFKSKNSAYVTLCTMHDSNEEWWWCGGGVVNCLEEGWLRLSTEEEASERNHSTGVVADQHSTSSASG